MSLIVQKECNSKSLLGSLLLPIRVSIFSSDNLWLIFALIEYNLNIPFVCEKATNNYLASKKKKRKKREKKKVEKQKKNQTTCLK